jgi:hypothetical protein
MKSNLHYELTIVEDFLLPKAPAIVASPAVLGEVIAVFARMTDTSLSLIREPHDSHHDRPGGRDKRGGGDKNEREEG